MRALSSLLTGRGTRSRGIIGALLVVTILVPVALLLSLMPQRGSQNIKAALVNLDIPITDTATPVAVGKLLTENLVTTAEGFDWTLTDPATASAGLANGAYLAVVTVPADFSKTTTTMGTATPQQSVLGVQTSASHGYLAGSIATALSRSLPTGVSAQLTSGYVAGTLSGFEKLGTGLGTASAGAAQIAEGTAQAAAGSAQIAAGTGTLASGLDTLSGIFRGFPQGTRDLGSLTAAGAAASGDLALRLLGESATSGLLVAGQDVQSARLDAIHAAIEARPDMPASELLAQIDELRGGSSDLAATSGRQQEALAKDAVDAGVVAIGAGVIAEVSGPVADGMDKMSGALDQAASGASTLTSANEQLAGGLNALAGGGSQLASGLGTVQASIPQYTTAQQQQIATVVATPITVEAASVAGPDTAWAASLAALAPIALWLGALVLFLFVAPFSAAALTTQASVVRVVRTGAGVAVLVGLAQAVPLGIVLAVTGAAGDRLLVAAGLLAGSAVVFALLHQGLVAAFGRGGLVVSLVALGIQVVAAGTLVPGLNDGPLSLLPLSIALQGMQSVFGGSLAGVLSALVGLAVWGIVGAMVTLIAVTSRRRRAAALAVVD